MRTFEFTDEETRLLRDAVEEKLNTYEDLIRDAETEEDFDFVDRLEKEEDAVYRLFNKLTERKDKTEKI